ncbi:MAG: CotH kinase family protein [Ignavibacteriales bacterium]|nr:CotH kinase family protein [Ignavibacteriales bacterium]
MKNNMLYVNFKFFVLISIFFLPLNIIYTQNIDSGWKLYDDSQVAIVEITMNPDDLIYMYTNLKSDSMHIAQVHFKNAQIDETIDSVGIRLRGNTSRDAQKKSLKLSFNHFINGRQFHKVDDLNLNGEHNDPSIIRSKLVWDLCKDIGMKGSRAAHTAVYINGQYYGLYISVESIDDEFLKKNFNDDSGNLWKCLYPADLVYKGTNPNLYKKIENGRRVYDLSTNQEKDDYSKLARLIGIINTTPNNLLEDSLESVLSVTEVLKYFAMNIMVGSWDDYWFLKNNYYIYHEPAADIFHWLPYDYDNTFGIDWFNVDWTNSNPYVFGNSDNSPRPLVTKVIGNSQYRNLYTHFLDFYRNNVFKLSIWESRIDSLKSRITQYAETDTFRTKDYNFTMLDFNNSYSANSYSNKHVKRGIKEYVNNRYNTLGTYLNWQAAKPIIYSINWFPKNPRPTDTIFVVASAFSKSGLKDVTIKFSFENEGNIFDYPMTFQPVANTKKVEEADKWIGKILPLGLGKSGSFVISVSDINNLSQIYPRKSANKIQTPSSTSFGLVINEFLAKNDNTIKDQDGENDDWVELYNSTNNSISLRGKFLTNSKKNLMQWKLTDNNLVLEPGKFLLVWCDIDTTQSGLHTNFKLSVDGEFIALVDSDGTTVLDSISFGTQTADISFGRFPDGGNNWQFLKPTPSLNNVLTKADNDPMLPKEFNITAFPNPFNPSTNIQYKLPIKSNVKISIYNLLGKRIWFKEEADKLAGNYSIIWNGIENSGMPTSSGIYFCQIEAGKWIKTIKLLLMK